MSLRSESRVLAVVTVLAAAAAVLVAPLLPLRALAQTAPPQPPPPGARVLRVSGEGRVRVAPDVAVILAGVETTGPDVKKVTQDAAGRMRKILAALADVGIAEKDVQTSRHDVQVERPWNQSLGRPGPITGYTVSDELRITVRNLDRLGPAIDRVTAAGANAFRGLSFQKDDPAPERARALAAAYGAARAKAEALAKAAGVTLGEVLQLSEAGGAQPIPMAMPFKMAAESRDAGTPVSAGEVEITSSVDVVYAIR